MDELIEAIKQKTGLPADKAKDAAEAALGFLKERLPDPIASQIDGFLEGNASSIADGVGDVTNKLKGMFGN
jgi:hypothetical protein